MTQDLQSLRARLHGIEQTIPLLEAIGSVAEMAHRRASSSVEPARVYADEVHSTLERLLASLPRENLPAFALDSGATGLVAILAVSSERGLCGAFNRNVATKVQTVYRQLRSEGVGVQIVCWGGRAKRLLESSGLPVVLYKELPSMALPTYEMVEDLALDLLDLQEKEGLRRLMAVYNEPEHRLRYQTCVRQLLPPGLVERTKSDPSWEIKPFGDELSLLVHALAEQLITALYQIAIESALSEQSARIASMRLAVDNARRLAEQLRFEYNLAAQLRTTNALLQLFSGYQIMTEGRNRRV